MDTTHSRRLRGRGPLLAFAVAVSAVFAVACAADLEGKPEDYPNAYMPAGGSHSGAGAASVVAGASGAPAGGAPAGGTGAAGAPSTPKPPPPDPACVADVLANNTCMVCHGTDSFNLIGGGLDLRGSDLGKRLSATKAIYKVDDPAKCVPGALLIDPAMPANSILLQKLKGTQACGAPMPAAPGLTNPTALKCIEDWVMSFGP